jgi:hypothetical protein
MISRIAPRFLSALLFLSFAAFLTSCGEDDPTNASTNSDLQGDWTATSYVVSGAETIGILNSSLTLTFTSNGDESGTMQGTITDINGGSSATAFSYDVLDNGDRIRIGSDTLDMSASESDLSLNGRLFGFSSTVIANK